MESVEPEPRTRRRAALQTLALASALALAMHEVFVVIAPWVHGASAPTDPRDIVGWGRSWLLPADGLEMPVMVLATTALLLFSLALTSWWVRQPRPGFLPLEWGLVGGLLWLLSGTQTSNFTPLPNGAVLSVGLALAAVALGFGLASLAAGRRWLTILLGAIATLALAVVAVASSRQPAVYDYGFYIAPALKLAQGERLGSFYVQYNLIGTEFVRLMMAARLQLHEIQAGINALFAAWFVLYALLARRLMEGRFVRVLFMVALVLVRFVAIDGGPACNPQVGSLRMDLWVLLMLALERFGYASPVTAAAFALGYVADNTFGAVFFGFYVGALALQLIVDWRAGKKPTRNQALALVAPLGLAVVFQLATFGSLTNPAAKAYQGLHIGFLPIEPNSMFWAVLWGLLASVGPLMLDPQPRRRAVSLFLLPIAAGMLSYFHGRSHDHNLLNVSGVWVLTLFVALDRLRTCGVPRAVGAVLGLALVCLAAWGTGLRAQQKYEIMTTHFAQKRLIEPFEYDVRPDLIPFLKDLSAKEPKVFVFGSGDAYLNYRAGLRQQGYFAPFYASLYVEPTATFVRDLLDKGTVVLLLDADLYGAQSIAAAKAFGGRQLGFTQNGPFKQLFLSPAGR